MYQFTFLAFFVLLYSFLELFILSKRNKSCSNFHFVRSIPTESSRVKIHTVQSDQRKPESIDCCFYRIYLNYHERGQEFPVKSMVTETSPLKGQLNGDRRVTLTAAITIPLRFPRTMETRVSRKTVKVEFHEATYGKRWAQHLANRFLPRIKRFL